MKNISSDDGWTTIIKPRVNSFKLNLREIWQYRDLLIMFVKRDFVSFYKQTVLGPLWFFIQPLLTTMVFIFVFGRLAGISTDGLPPLVFYLGGITAWNYFADCITKTSTVFKDNANIFGKVYFPRMVMPLSIVVSNLVRFGVQLILFFIAVIYFAVQGYSFQMSWQALYIFPLLVVIMAFLGLGIGLIVTAVTTRYRDLSFLITFGVQLLMYATTVIYPLSSIHGHYRGIIELNPMTNILEAFRFIFLGRGEFSSDGLLYSAIVTLAILLAGVIIFNRTERNFVDTI